MFVNCDVSVNVCFMLLWEYMIFFILLYENFEIKGFFLLLIFGRYCVCIWIGFCGSGCFWFGGVCVFCFCDY